MMPLKQEIELYCSLKNKPLCFAEITHDHPEWFGNAFATFDTLNIIPLFGFTPEVIAALQELLGERTLSLVNVKDSAMFSYSTQGKIPRFAPMAQHGWVKYPVPHWIPCLLYHKDLLLIHLRQRQFPPHLVVDFSHFRSHKQQQEVEVRKDQIRWAS